MDYYIPSFRQLFQQVYGVVQNGTRALIVHIARSVQMLTDAPEELCDLQGT